mmetsp:Transcript_26411/g.30302  ORF Transcript_26411/g.30302 Transcript_26411/m.30302 type:complete len:90 (-) Transcript_26411:230-499(-)
MLTLPQWAWSMVFANKTGCFDFPAVIFIIHTKPQFRKLGGYLNKDGNPPDERVKRVTGKGKRKKLVGQKRKLKNSRGDLHKISDSMSVR